MSAVATAGKTCGWCGASLLEQRQRYCGKRCRQTAFRLRRRRDGAVAPAAPPGVFAYADPPYPGHAWRYRSQPTFAGEVDHRALTKSLVDARLVGWALSTSSAALREVLPLCPAGARVLAWVKPTPPQGAGLCVRWEPLIVVGGRATHHPVRDWLCAAPARGGGVDLVGRKPLAFADFLFKALGMGDGDTLVDLFPGTRAVSKAWLSLGAGRRVAEVLATTSVAESSSTSLTPGRHSREGSR